MFEQRNKPFYVIIIFFVRALVGLGVFSFFLSYYLCLFELQYIKRAREFLDFKNTVEIECTHMRTAVHAHTFRHILCVWLRVSFLKQQQQHQQQWRITKIMWYVCAFVCTCTNICNTRKSQDLVDFISFFFLLYAASCSTLFISVWNALIKQSVIVRMFISLC